MIPKISSGIPDLHILAHLYLTSQTFVLGNFLAGQVVELGREHISATFVDVALAHGAGTPASAGRGEKNTFIGKSGQQGRSGLDQERVFLVAIDNDLDVSLRDKALPRRNQHHRQQKNYRGENYNCK